MKATAKSELYKMLPSVDELLRLDLIAQSVPSQGHGAVTSAIRSVLARVRDEIARGALDEKGVGLAIEGLPAAIASELRRASAPSLRPVINATGVILHTNLGRAPLSVAALDHARVVSLGYSNL